MAENPQSTYGSTSSRHRSRGSLITSASGIADSTISFNTYATGITEGSLCLSQFPPPPMTFSAPPSTDRILPSPAQSTFTVTSSAPINFTTLPGFSSPAQSTFTVTAPQLVNSVSRVLSPIVRPQLIVEQQRMHSPAQSTFSVTPSTPIPVHAPPVPVAQPMPSAANREPFYDSLPSDRHGSTLRPPHSDPPDQPQSQNFTSLPQVGRLSPFDWHEGSSIISVDPAEERMLSTSFITGLLSSVPVKAPGDTSAPHSPHTYQADVNSLASEMSYPPSSRYHERVAGSTRCSSILYSPSSPAEGVDPTITSENAIIPSCEGNGSIVQPEPGLARKVSIVGMTQPTLRHVSDASSMLESFHSQSSAMHSTKPLNPYPPSAFSSIMGRTRSIDIQPPIATSQSLTPAAPLHSELEASSKQWAKTQRRESTYSSRTVKSHVSSLISSAGQHTARVVRVTKEWLRIKPLPPVPTIPSMSLYQELEHRRMEDAVPLPQLAERADRLNTMLNSGHHSHDSIGSSSGLGSEKVSPHETRASGFQVASGGRRRQSVAFAVQRPGDRDSLLRSKSLLKRPISRNVKIKLCVVFSALTMLVLVGTITGVVAGRKHSYSLNCATNRTGNTCSLGKLYAPFTCHRN
jgi:hypothetical protein